MEDLISKLSWSSDVTKDCVLPFYRRPTKLREGNAFSNVCLFTGRRGLHVTITHDTLDLTVQGHHQAPASPRHGTSLKGLPKSPYPSPLLLTTDGQDGTCRGTPIGADIVGYGWEAGGKHPTGMLSCSLIILGLRGLKSFSSGWDYPVKLHTRQFHAN